MYADEINENVKKSKASRNKDDYAYTYEYEEEVWDSKFG